MGLMDFATSVLTSYKADTTDQKAKVKELIGLEKEHAEQAIKAAEARNKSIDSTIDKLGKVGLAFNTLTQIARVAFDGLEQYGHKLDLQAAAGAVSIDKLSRAASGLKSEMELLEHAAVFNKSAFQLTEEQMAQVEKGMHALEERGKSSEEVWGAVSTALTKGTVKALEGLIGPIQKSGDAFDVNGDVLQTYGARAKAVDAILKQLSATSAEAAVGDYDEADRIQSVTVRITDSMEHIKESMGKMVIALEPLIRAVGALGEKTGDIVSKVADGWNNISDIAQYMFGGVSREDALKRIGGRGGVDLSPNAGSDRLENYLAQGGSTANFITAQLLQDLNTVDDPNAGGLSFNAPRDLSNLFQRGNMIADQAAALLFERIEKAKKRYQEGQQKAKELLEERKRLADTVSKSLTDDLVKQLEGEIEQERSARSSAELRGYMNARAPAGAEVQSSQLEGALRARTAEAYNIFDRQRRGSFLEATFGKIDEFNVYKSAFDSLSTAITAGFEAWITGSKSFASAFREALAKTMLGESLSMAAQAIKATALGIFSAATGDAAHAALYFTSAAEFAAAAIAFGAGAAVLGGGGGSSGGRGGGGGAAAPNVANAGPSAPQTQSIIVIGDSFAEDTPRMRQLKAERLVSLARGNSAVVYG